MFENMRETGKIVIAEAQTIFRDALRVIVRSNPAYEVIGEARNALEAIRSVESHPPDLILIEPFTSEMKGSEVLAEIKRRSPSTKILVLTVRKGHEDILAALQAGASGYILKDAYTKELMLALENIISDKTYLDPSISKKLIEGYLEGRKHFKSCTSWDLLTNREREVLKMITEGYRNRSIADYLCISTKTVEKHRANLMRKLDLHSISSLTTFAFESADRCGEILLGSRNVLPPKLAGARV